MSRYIDAEKLSNMIEAKADTLIEGKEAFLYVAKWLDLLPATDVVEVVRCKDCIHYNRISGVCMHFGYYTYQPDVDDDDYCSYGERKEG